MFVVKSEMPPGKQTGQERLGTNHLLVANKLPCSGRVQPKTPGDEPQQRSTEEVSTLAFQAGLAQKFLETSICDHESAAKYWKHHATSHDAND